MSSLTLQLLISSSARLVAKVFALLAFILTSSYLCAIGHAQEGTAGVKKPVDAFVGRVEHNLEKTPNEAIFIGLPKAITTESGELLVYPNTTSTSVSPNQENNGFQFGDTRQSTIFSGSGDAPMALTPQEYLDRTNQSQSPTSILDSSSGALGNYNETSPYEPIFQHLDRGNQPDRSRLGRLSDRLFGCCSGRPLNYFLSDRLFGCSNVPAGIGSERLGYSMFLIDTPPLNNTRLRFNAFYNQTRFSDGKKPADITLFDSQEVRLQFEVGSPKFSVTTELPYVAINPETAPNHSGYGDMSITTKTVLKDGNNVQITQIFRSFIASGNFANNLGVGHASFETGAVIRRKFRPQTEFAGELLYHWPAGDGEQIMKWGFGMTHVAYDSDDFSILPSLELTGWSILDGDPIISGFHSFTLTPAVRFAFDRPSDLGLFDAGVAASIPLSDDRWYNQAIMLEFRWTF